MTHKQTIVGMDDTSFRSSFKKCFGVSIEEFCHAETPAQTQIRILRIEEAFSCVNCIVMDHVIAFLEACGKDTSQNRAAARLLMVELSHESAN